MTNQPPSDPSAGLDLSIGQCAALATIIEATAPKPGNVHRGADFEDASYPDFIVAATLMAAVFDRAAQQSVGRTVLEAIEVTQAAVATNTNLGTVLLIAPLAKVPRATALETGVAEVLKQLSADDTRDVYRAITLAKPGGLGRTESADVSGPAPDDLVAAMRLAEDRDLVARQYSRNFHEVLGVVVPWLTAALSAGLSLADAVVRVHLQLMSEYPDSLIARRRGVQIATQSAALAHQVLNAGQPGDEAYDYALADLDFWLRADGHQRNPGTTADLLAAGLFAALRDGIIKPPLRLARL